MADEITAQSRLTIRNGNYSYDSGQLNVTATQTASGAGGPGIVSVTTSDAAVSIPGVSSKGWAFLKNLDTTNYVEWGPESGGAMVAAGRLGPGQGHLVKLSPSMVLRMQANTDTCKVQVVVHEA